MDFMKRKGFDEKLLLRRLTVRRKDGESFYDKFRNRIMFPIIDMKGNVIAWSEG